MRKSLDAKRSNGTLDQDAYDKALLRLTNLEGRTRTARSATLSSLP